MTCNELSTLIIQNRDSIAFLVGNGLHNYETYNKGVSGKVCWKELIADIRKELSPNNSHRTEGKLPKKFDLIVQESLHKETTKDIPCTTKNLSALIKSTEKISPSRNFEVDTILQPSSRLYIGNQEQVLLNSLIRNERLKQAEKEYLRRIDELYKSLGLKTNPSSFDVQAFALHIALGGHTVDFVAKQIIKSRFENYTLQNWIAPFLRVADRISAPILTTNYDTSLSKFVGIPPRITAGGNNKIQEGFPFETYFAPSPINHPWDSFAIWHIHGLYNYVNSIRIGMTDYINLKHEIQARLNMTTNPLADDHWSSNNSWLSVVFRKNLFIWGLGLESDEEVLWWLLKERAKYGLAGWYVCRDTENVVGTKTKNLRDVGLEILKVDNIDLHENVWQQIMSDL